MCSGTASALPAVEVDNGMIFGGQSTMAVNATAMTHNLSDLDAVVEVYTATWCDNCVYVESALEERGLAKKKQQAAILLRWPYFFAGSSIFEIKYFLKKKYFHLA